MMSKLAYPTENDSVAITSHLFGCYGSFAHKTIKDLRKSRRFIVDSRDTDGLASDGDYYGWFCGIWLDVESEHEVTITLENNTPKSPAVDSALESLESEGSAQVAFRVTQEKLRDLRHLADQIDEIVKPGQYYSTPSYKYMCPRTADSLRKVAGHLDDFWATFSPSVETTLN